MLATKIEDAKREEGFTLIELLVVVIIIGILAAIAIPVFLNQRQSAWRGTTETDVRNAAMVVETFYTSERAYPSTELTWAGPGVVELAEGDSPTYEIVVSEGVTMTYDVAGDGNSFTIIGEHAQLGDEEFEYNSATGGLLRAPAGGGS